MATIPQDACPSGAVSPAPNAVMAPAEVPPDDNPSGIDPEVGRPTSVKGWRYRPVGMAC
jgi:hypothetical protein